MHRTTYHVEKMDCAAEEHLVRMRLGGPDGLRKRRGVTAALAVGLAALVLALASCTHLTVGHSASQAAVEAVRSSNPEGRTRAHAPTLPDRLRRVWIDSDTACGGSFLRDVDDCFAVAEALAAPSLDVVGLSATHGNASLEETGPILRALADLIRQRAGNQFAVPVVVDGGRDRHDLGRSSGASRALINALEEGPLTVLALGPLTTVATALAERPDLAGYIEEVVAVMGRRPGEILFPADTRIVAFVDLNFGADPDAVQAILASEVPITLLPFEASIQVRVTPTDLGRIAGSGAVGAWLASQAGSWMRFWTQTLGEPGFAPFDALAVGYLLAPGHLGCRSTPAVVRTGPPLPFRQPELIVGAEVESERRVRYCTEVRPGFKAEMLDRLAALPR